jgi:dTDP-4-amino-4,6-dideoxygalactose transaminase
VDVAQHTLSLSPEKLEAFLNKHAYLSNDGNCFNKTTGKRIAACLPMHTFGLPGRIDELNAICQQFNIPLVEDAAESLGSTYKAHHTGSFGLMGTFSFNGNKTVTSGGGGALVTNDLETANYAKHLTTTAKARDGWQFGHNQVGYNYRMPNLNAAFACAQLEMLHHFVQNKRETAQAYADFFKDSSYTFIQETSDAYSNYWLNSILVNDREERDALLDYANEQGIMARPAWQVLHHLPMYKDCFKTDLTNAEWLEQRIVHLPSSVRL